MPGADSRTQLWTKPTIAAGTMHNMNTKYDTNKCQGMDSVRTNLSKYAYGYSIYCIIARTSEDIIILYYELVVVLCILASTNIESDLVCILCIQYSSTTRVGVQCIRARSMHTVYIL